MKQVIDTRKYEGTTAGEVARVLQHFGFELAPSQQRADIVFATHHKAGLRIPIHSEFEAELYPATVAGVRMQVEMWKIATGDKFDAALAEVRKSSAESS